MFNEGIRRLFRHDDAKKRWEKRGVELYMMVEDLKEHPDSEGLMVLLSSALDLCERRLAGIKKLESVDDQELMDHVKQVLNDVKKW